MVMIGKVINIIIYIYFICIIKFRPIYFKRPLVATMSDVPLKLSQPLPAQQSNIP